MSASSGGRKSVPPRKTPKAVRLMIGADVDVNIKIYLSPRALAGLAALGASGAVWSLLLR